MKYLEENVAAADVTLDAEDLDALEQAVPRDAVAGDRYGDMSTSTPDTADRSGRRHQSRPAPVPGPRTHPPAPGNHPGQRLRYCQ